MISYHVPYDDVFEDVAVVVRARRHFFCLSLALQRNIIQGVSFNWYPPKNHKYGKKLKYQNWYPPKIHKYGKKLKYQNWYPPQIH